MFVVYKWHSKSCDLILRFINSFFREDDVSVVEL